MTIQIFKKPDGMYDCFDKETGKWLISRLSPDNIFSWLSEQKEPVSIEFEDCEVTRVLKQHQNTNG